MLRVKTQGLCNTTLTAEAKYSINFTKSRKKKFVLSLHYNGSNSFSFVNATKIYQFKAKDSEIKPHSLRLENISKDFTADDMKKTNKQTKTKNNNNNNKIGFNGYVHNFSIDYNIIDTSNINVIHKCFMKKT